MAALMQPFQPLLVKLGGNRELKYVATAESAGISRTLVGETLFSGLYLNELLTRLLPKFDAAPTLFAAYGDAIEVISTSADRSSPCVGSSYCCWRSLAIKFSGSVILRSVLFNRLHIIVISPIGDLCPVGKQTGHS